MKLRRAVVFSFLFLFTACTSKLQIEDLVEGKGEGVKVGDIVRVHYQGWLIKDGTVFDSSLARNQPYTFTVGAGRVIDGWDQGILGMKVGGKRRLGIPSSMGYGGQKRASIPAHSDLAFEIELLEIISAAKLISPQQSSTPIEKK